MLSRREWIERFATLVTMAGFARQAAAAGANGKVTQAAAQYQNHPKNGQMCGMCKFYIPPGGRAGAGMMGGGMMGRGMTRGHAGMMAAGTCELVEGSIGPMGWCLLYRPLSG
ncbi:MAG TPA: hypothetical protein VM755_02825 [Stellaceae bacterium]|nr:hypothetical protein [Stellaceae bacterium]